MNQIINNQIQPLHDREKLTIRTIRMRQKKNYDVMIQELKQEVGAMYQRSVTRELVGFVIIK